LQIKKSHRDFFKITSLLWGFAIVSSLLVFFNQLVLGRLNFLLVNFLDSLTTTIYCAPPVKLPFSYLMGLNHEGVVRNFDVAAYSYPELCFFADFAHEELRFAAKTAVANKETLIQLAMSDTQYQGSD
jgi:hypothetical protein